MTLLKTAVDEKIFDTRIVERGASKGLRRPDEIAKHEAKLPDEAAFATTLNVEELFSTIKGKSSLRK